MGADSSKLSHPAKRFKCPGRGPSEESFKDAFATPQLKAMAIAVHLFVVTAKETASRASMFVSGNGSWDSVARAFFVKEGELPTGGDAQNLGKDLKAAFEIQSLDKNINDKNQASYEPRVSLVYTVVGANKSQAMKLSAPFTMYIQDDTAFRSVIKALGGGSVDNVADLVKKYTLAVAAMCAAEGKNNK